MIISGDKDVKKQFDSEKVYKKVYIDRVDSSTDASDYINSIIEKVEDHTIVSFRLGRYLLCDYISVKDKKDIIIEGNNSVFLQYYDSSNYGEKCSDIFHIEDCRNIVLRNFNIETSAPGQLSGIISEITEDYIDVKVKSNIEFTGDEHFHIGYSHTDEGNVTYAIAWNKERSEKYAVLADEIPCTRALIKNLEHKKISEDTIRIYKENMPKEPDGGPCDGVPMKCGELFSMRYNYYGPVALVFRNTDTAYLEDINIKSFGGFVALVLPRCRDFTFNRFNILPANPDSQLFSCNADGINFTGLSGKLLLRNCMFRNTGDDCLNVHTQVFYAKELKERQIKLGYQKSNPIISEYWAKAGDVLHVFDSENHTRKKDITVTDFKDKTVFYDGDSDISEGDFIINDTYRPEVVVENCVSYNMRDRAYYIAGAKKVTITGCEFYNTSGCAMLVTGGFGSWAEGAGVENVEFYNNLVSGCETWSSSGSNAAISVNFGKGDRHTAPMYRNISIHDNVFENINGPIAKFMTSENVYFGNNILCRCKYSDKDIETVTCKNVTIENNEIIE